MPFRFLHTADLHLDSPLVSLALRNADLADLVRGTSRRALERIVDIAIAEEVDALLIAGDLYDGAQTSMSTALFLVSEMRRLESAGIRVFVIRGNHDAQSQITHELTFPPNVHVFDGRGKPLAIGALASGREVVLHGVSFGKPQAPASLLPSFRPPIDGAVNIGMLHTSLGGSAGHDNYAPASVAELVAHGFDYWALGHIHQRAVHSSAPHVVMPGNPQGRDINEAGAKSAVLVSVDDDGTVTIDERATATAIFRRLPVDLGGVGEWEEMLARVRQALAAASAETGDAQLIARIELAGATPLAWTLRRDEDLLLADLQSVADAVGRCWIEQVGLSVVPISDREAGFDALSELDRLMEESVLPSHAFETELRALAADLLKQLPREARDLLAPDEAAEARLLAESAERGRADVLAALMATAGPETS